MVIINKLSIATAIATAALFGGISLANGGTYVQQQPAHSIFVGIGGGYANTEFNHHYNASLHIPGLISAIASETVQDHADNLAPTVQIGFLKSTNHPNFFWGAKAEDTYLDASTNSGNWNSLYRTKANNLFSLLALAGTKLNENNTVTFGIGPSAEQIQEKINAIASINRLLASSPFVANANFDQSKTDWGGTAEIGLQHYFTPSWFIDANYSYTLLGRKTFQTVNSGFGAASDSVRPTTQQVMLTINKKFM